MCYRGEVALYLMFTWLSLHPFPIVLPALNRASFWFCVGGLCLSWEVQSPVVIFICKKKGKPVPLDKAGIVLHAQIEACQRLRALNIPWAVPARKPQAAEQSECHLREASFVSRGRRRQSLSRV